MNYNLIDTHFHLDHYVNHNDLYNEINSLKQYTLCVTDSPGVYVSCNKIYKTNKYIKFALGFHPCNKLLNSKDFMDFMHLVDTAKYIGEVGMDFSSSKYLPKDKQKKYFSEIIKVASLQNKPITVHLRKSENYAIEIIERYKPQKCIIHWFNGNEEQLQSLLKLNCYFSINTNMINNVRKNQQLLILPKNRLLIESDGPHTKINSKKYSPCMLETAYSQIARCLGITKLHQQIYSNFNELLSK